MVTFFQKKLVFIHFLCPIPAAEPLGWHWCTPAPLLGDDTSWNRSNYPPCATPPTTSTKKKELPRCLSYCSLGTPLQPLILCPSWYSTAVFTVLSHSLCLCAKYCSRHFNAVKWVPSLSSFYRWENRSTKGQGPCPESSKQSGRMGTCFWAVRFQRLGSQQKSQMTLAVWDLGLGGREEKFSFLRSTFLNVWIFFITV